MQRTKFRPIRQAEFLEPCPNLRALIDRDRDGGRTSSPQAIAFVLRTCGCAVCGERRAGSNGYTEATP
jgi:hypothetical protein